MIFCKTLEFPGISRNLQKMINFHEICGFPVLDVNSIDLALVFIRVGAKCGNDCFCVEIVAREWGLCYFYDICSSFQLPTSFNADFTKNCTSQPMV